MVKEVFKEISKMKTYQNKNYSSPISLPYVLQNEDQKVLESLVK